MYLSILFEISVVIQTWHLLLFIQKLRTNRAVIEHCIIHSQALKCLSHHALIFAKSDGNVGIQYL